MAKIGYLILAHNNFIHLRRLVESLQGQNCYIFIHIDKKSKSSFNMTGLNNNVILLENRIDVKWCGYSTINATLALMNKAYQYDCDRFVLLSGADYPIRSDIFIEEFFNKSHDEYISIIEMPQKHKPLDRLEMYHLEAGRSKVLGSVNKIIKTISKTLGIKRTIPLKFKDYTLYAGSQWWALSRESVEYILNFVALEDAFCEYYRHAWVPDEMFFHTIIGNSPFRPNIKSNITYIDWTLGKPPFPSYIDMIHLDTMQSFQTKHPMPYLFARKFDDTSEQILNVINSTMRK